MQLHNQSLLTGRPPPVLIRQPLIQFSFPQQDVSTDDSSRARAGTVSHPPMTSLRPGMFYPTYVQAAPAAVQGSNTNPPSPSLAHAVPDLRRNPRRSSVANGSPSGSLRSHSQPARSVHSPVMQGLVPLHSSIPSDASRSSRDRAPPGSPGRTETESSLNSLSASTVTTPTFFDEHRPSEFGGYYLMPHTYHPGYMAMSLPATAYLQAADYRTAMPVYSDPFGSAADSNATPTAQPVSPRGYSVPAQTNRDRGGPLIIDGSVPPQESKASSRDDYSDRYVSPSGTSDTVVGWEVPSEKADVFSNGVQDNTFEMDPFSTTKEQDCHATQIAKDTDSNLNGRFQGLRLATANNTEPLKSFSERKNGKPVYVNGEFSPSRHSHQQRHQGKPNDKSSSTGNHTGNKDTLSSSPTHRNRTNGADSDKPNGVSHNHSHKSKPKALQDTHAGSPLSSLNRKDAQPASLPRKPDGLPPLNGGRDHNHSNGGWQTTKKKHRRNVKSLAETQHHPHLAEPLPVDESLRKGG
jgi:hypothetical protein